MRKLLATLIVLSACGDPPVAPAPDAPRGRGAVTGQVVVSGAARGDVVVLLLRADDPPPPEGTGHPVSVTVVPARSLFGSPPASGNGPFTAPYAFSLVPAGTYTVRAFLDACAQAASCHGDFVPFFSVTNQPDAGDLGGGHAHLEGSRIVFDPVTVAADGAVDGVTVALDESIPGTRFPGRPAFLVDAQTPPAGTTPGALRLKAKTVEEAGVVEHEGRFFLRYASLSGTGKPEDLDGDGLPDVFPKIFLRKISNADPTGLHDENDRDGDGHVDATAEADTNWPYDDPGLDKHRPRAVLIPAVLDPTKALPLLAASDGSPDMTKVVPLDVLEILVSPVAVDAADPTKPHKLAAIPPGRYAIVVMEGSGQTWRLPNELEPGVEKLLDPQTSGIADQGASYAIPNGSGLLLPGGLSGVSHYAAGAPANVYVFAWKAPHQPPPLGTDLPDAASVVFAWDQTPTASGYDASWRLSGLADGTWTVRFLGDLDHNFYAALPVTADGSAGDVAGQLAGLDVAGGLADQGRVELDTVIPLDRPRFRVRGVAEDGQGGLTAPLGFAVGEIAPVVFELEAGPTGFRPFDGAAAVTLFTVAALDPGLSAGADNLPQIFPRLFLRLMDASGADDPTRFVVIPVSVDPLPFLPALPGTPLPAARVRAVALPTAFDVATGKRLAAPPPGRYALIAVNATGQTWRLPNALAPSQSGSTAFDTASQGVYFQVTPPPSPLPKGSISGSVRLPVACPTPADCGNVYLFAFAKGFGPPPGELGMPVGAAVVLADELAASGGGGPASAPFTIPALAAGSYTLRALYDASRDFHPAFAALSGPSRKDRTGAAIDASFQLRVVDVAEADVPGVDVTILGEIDRERPMLSVVGAASGNAVPVSGVAGGKLVVLGAPDVALPPILVPDKTRVTFTVKPSAAGADLDGDGFPDLNLAAALSRVDDRSDLLDASPRTVVPAHVSPLPYLPLFADANGVVPPNAPAIEVTQALVIVPPLALGLDQGAPQVLGAIPPGRYALNFFSGPMHWRLPNETGARFLDPRAAALAPTANAGQGTVIDVPDPGATAPASLGGAVTYSAARPMTIVVTAFSTAAPPPPAGNGEPAGSIVVPPAFQGQAGGNWVAPFKIDRLAAGDYLVAVFADADGDFSPYYRIRANPTAGDVVGGVLSAACASPLPLKPVTAPNPIPLLATLCGPMPSERPQFGVTGASGLSRGSVSPGSTVDLVLAGKAFKNAVVQGGSTPGFLVQAGFPKLVLRQLDDQDPTGLSWASHKIVILATLDPATPAGPAASLTFKVPRGAVDLTNPGSPQPVDPPLGKYAMTLVSITGQSWTVPNELGPALYPPASYAVLTQQSPDAPGQAQTFDIAP
jgi:hypothetical protein